MSCFSQIRKKSCNQFNINISLTSKSKLIIFSCETPQIAHLITIIPFINFSKKSGRAKSYEKKNSYRKVIKPTYPLCLYYTLKSHKLQQQINFFLKFFNELFTQSIRYKTQCYIHQTKPKRNRSLAYHTR